jgi:hypothetical protein
MDIASSSWLTITHNPPLPSKYELSILLHLTRKEIVKIPLRFR